MAHCQLCLKISCKTVRKFLHKVANWQTSRQTDTTTITYPSFSAEVIKGKYSNLPSVLYLLCPYTPFTRYSRFSNRLYNRFDNRLYCVNEQPTGCGFDNRVERTATVRSTVLNEQSLFVWQPAVYTIQQFVKPVTDWMFVYSIQPVVKPVWQPVVSCIQTFTRLSNRFDNRFDNRLYRVNGALSTGMTVPWRKPDATTVTQDVYNKWTITL